MIFAPTIVDDTISSLPLGSVAMSANTPMVGEGWTVYFPLFNVATALLGETVVDATVISLPLLTATLSILNPEAHSAYVSLPNSTTGVTATRLRAPNTYSPKEVRKAIQSIHGLSASQAEGIATVQTNVSILKSEVLAIDERVDFLESTISTNYSAETDDAVISGNAVYLKSNGHIGLANTSSASTHKVAGISLETKSATFAAQYAADGKLTLADWTDITGEAELSAGQTYYASADASGKITNVAPSSSGNYICPVGEAKTTLTLDIEIGQTVRL
jgi:hypothetical protein